MEIKVSQGLQLSPVITPRKISGKSCSSFHLLRCIEKQQWLQAAVSGHFPIRKGRSRGPIVLKVSCSSQKLPVSFPESEISLASVDESAILKNKSEEIEPYLNGRCVYLVGGYCFQSWWISTTFFGSFTFKKFSVDAGMMGSGKTTVGKVVSEALGYSFCDCDTLIEESVGGSSVAEIFKLHGESFFRDKESVVLQQLSSMHRLVVSTGGGAVVRPINWRHMRKGISVWLDVPLEALARRIAAIGTDSRPLLHQESGDPYSKAMKRLSALFKERGESYANADARVSLKNIAAKLGYDDVCSITPPEIAIEVLLQIQNFLKR